MKTLTVKQPWASLIVEGIKDIENRTWKCPEKYIGKRVLIHAAAKSWTWQKFIKYLYEKIPVFYKTFSENESWLETLPTGKIIGSVEIVDCVINHPSIWAEKSEIPYLADVLEDIHHFGRALKPDNLIYNWVLANPIKFPEPIPAKGKLSFWEHNMQCPEFAHFGATYPDARCIDGYLWDLDSADGQFFTQGGNDPCPYCNPDEYLDK